MSKTDPRVLRSRQLIIDAFFELSKHKDFDHISIGDITKQATINRSTFYAHFQDKYDLLNAIMDQTVTFDLTDIYDLTPAAHLTQLITRVYQFQQQIRQLCHKSAAMMQRTTQHRITSALADSLATLIKASPADSDTLAAYHAAGIYATVHSWPSDLAEAELAPVVAGLVALLVPRL